MANSMQVPFIIFVAVTGLAFLLQAGVLLAMFLSLRKAITSARDRSEGFEGKLLPVLLAMQEFLTAGKDVVGSAKALIEKLEPKLNSAAAELEIMAQDIHVQATRLQASVDEVAQMARRQVDRADGMTTSFLNGLDRVGSFVNQAVDVPIRQVAGVVAAARAVVETLRSPAPPRARRQSQAAPASPHAAYQTDDKDLFV